MYDNQGKKRSGFPDPLLPREKKEEKEYGLRYAKAIQDQWGKIEESNSLYRKRRRVFDRNRAYANGTQDTSIYKQLLNSLDPSNSDGSMLNLDFTPVPILPKFVRIVVNKILSREPYPNLEAVDPLSSAEKDRERRKVEMKVQSKPGLKQIEQMLGKDMGTKDTPDTLEEAEIFIDTNLKTSGEVAAQVATNMTLKWNDFADSVYRRCVNDIATVGMSVIKRSNDPSQGIRTDYVDPANFIHSYTEDPNFGDIVYAGHIERMSIQELKRRAGDQFTDEDYEKIAGKASKKYGYDSSKITQSSYDQYSNKNVYGYDEFMVDVLSFEFISVDTMYFEDKQNKYGNKNLYYKGSSYKKPKNSIFEREVKKVENATVYGGCYIMGCEDYLFDYGMKTNMPKNIHDLSRVNMSYSVVATNLQNMMPKSLVDSCVGFADQLQLTHLKIQQAVAKAKPDGLIIDIEGLENVQVGKGGELQPLELHDIYEQTGVFYYRSKNPDGGFQNPPIREIGNSIRNINELIGLYNHYLRLIRDTTGINEAMDASSPKGDALVGVREQAIAAGNNAIYDITNASMVLFKKVCSDIVKCLQVIHPESVLYHIYENAIGQENMKVLSSFKNLMLYNFGVQVVKNMEESEKMLLEQNIQMALSQKELDLEDAIAIRNLKDVNQAERLLIVRRKKRLQSNQQMAQQNSQMQAQAQAQAAQAASQGRQQEMQLEAQLKAAEIKLKAEYEVHTATALHQLKREIELIRAQATLGFRTEEQEFREKLEVLKEDRKDDRIKKQAVQQSKLISQRQGARGELKGAPKEGEAPDIDKAVDNILGQQ